uniref:RNA-directed DNA polymerase n=1 Tax=Strongyloides papillosus TaxID=174720 RepID=A0A0N5B4J2_STREA
MSKEILFLELKAILSCDTSGILVEDSELQEVVDNIRDIEKLSDKKKRCIAEEILEKKVKELKLDSSPVEKIELDDKEKESLVRVEDSSSDIEEPFGEEKRSLLRTEGSVAEIKESLLQVKKVLLSRRNLLLKESNRLLREKNLALKRKRSLLRLKKRRKNLLKVDEEEKVQESFCKLKIETSIVTEKKKRNMSLLKDITKYDCMNGSPIKEHLTILEETFILEDIDADRKKCSYLMLTVDQSLRDYIRSLSDELKSDWVSLTAHLEEKYPGEISVVSAKGKLRNMRINTSYHGFRNSALELVKTYRIAYPKRGDDEILEKLQELCAHSAPIWNMLNKAENKDLIQTIAKIEAYLASESKRNSILKGSTVGAGKARCFNCKEEGHKAAQCQKAVKSEANIECYKCKQKGHYANKCTNEVKLESKVNAVVTKNGSSVKKNLLYSDVVVNKVVSNVSNTCTSNDILIKCSIAYNDINVLALVDTESEINMITHDAAVRCGLALEPTNFHIRGIGGVDCVNAVTSIKLLGEELEVYVGKIPVAGIDILLGVNAVLNLGFHRLFGLSERARLTSPDDDQPVLLSISEVIEHSRETKVEGTIESSKSCYTNDEILAMLLERDERVMAAISFKKNDIGRFNEEVDVIVIDFMKASKDFMPYKFPEKMRQEGDKLINELLSTNTIVPGGAKLLHNIICVRKKTGDMRACVDMRYSNKYMHKCQYPIPRLDQFLYKTRGYRYYSVLDLPAAFHQFLLHSSQRDLFGIYYRGKCYRYQTLPQGCKNSPMLMQEKLSSLFDEDLISWYYDDGIICSYEFDDHMEKLLKVLLKLGEVGLKISHEKSIYCSSAVDFLGNRLEDGLVITESAKRTVNSIRPPSSVSEVRSLLGNLGFYSKYVRNYSQILFPITQLLKKSVDFVWSEACDAALVELKRILSSDVVLARLRLDLPLIIQSDSCERGYGVAMFQDFPGEGRRPVLFWSMKRPNRVKYRNSVYLEGHAVICFVRKHFHLLLGMDIFIESDNKPLVQAMTGGTSHPQLSAWAQELSFLSITWSYISKNVNDVADILSRVEKDEEGDDEPDEALEISPFREGVGLDKKHVCAITAIELKDHQRQWITDNGTDGLTKRVNSDYWGKVNPQGKWIPLASDELVEKEALLVHSFGHFNWRKVAAVLKHKVYNPKLESIVERCISACKTCQQCNVNGKKVKVSNWCSYMVPRENYAADICGPREGKYILHMVDSATLFWMVEVIPNVESDTVMMASLKLCWKYGFPNSWRSDNAPYWNKTMEKLGEFGCDVSTGNPYHHNGNSVAENAIGNLQHVMRKILTDQIDRNKKPMDLEDVVEWSVIFHNSIAEEGESPSELFLGHKLKYPSYVEKHSYSEEGSDAARDVELLRLEMLSKSSAQRMMKKIVREEKEMKKSKDSTVMNERMYKIGDLVLTSSCWKKLKAKWEGPYVIKEIHGSTAVLERAVKAVNGKKRGRPPKNVISRNLVQLKKFKDGDVLRGGE